VNKMMMKNMETPQMGVVLVVFEICIFSL